MRVWAGAWQVVRIRLIMLTWQTFPQEDLDADLLAHYGDDEEEGPAKDEL